MTTQKFPKSSNLVRLRPSWIVFAAGFGIMNIGISHAWLVPVLHHRDWYFTLFYIIIGLLIILYSFLVARIEKEERQAKEAQQKKEQQLEKIQKINRACLEQHEISVQGIYLHLYLHYFDKDLHPNAPGFSYSVYKKIWILVYNDRKIYDRNLRDCLLQILDCFVFKSERDSSSGADIRKDSFNLKDMGNIKKNKKIFLEAGRKLDELVGSNFFTDE